MNHGDIVYSLKHHTCGIVLTLYEDNVNVLNYDFSITWENKKDLRKVGTTDAIFKAMYELKKCESKCNEM